MQANITKIVTDFEMSNVPLLIIICRSVPNDCCVVFVCVLSMRCNCTQLNMQQLSQVKVVQADEWYVGQLSRALGEKGFAASQASRFLNPLATWQLGNLTTSQAALNDTTLLPADNASCFIACHSWKQVTRVQKYVESALSKNRQWGGAL